MVGERKIDYSVVIFLEKEPLKSWKSGRLGSKFSLKLNKEDPKVVEYALQNSKISQKKPG